MKIAIAAAAGTVARQLTRHLMPRVHEGSLSLVLLDRRASRLSCCPGVAVAVGSLDDPAHVSRATRGCDALFWLTPPAHKAPDMLAFHERFGVAAAQAVRRNGISRVVHVSSQGAEHAEGTGVVLGLRLIESILDAHKGVCHLRPAFFMDNYLSQQAAVRGGSCVCFPVAAATRCAMVSTRDLAHEAARWLLSPEAPRHHIPVLGPEDVAFGEAAWVLSGALGRDVQHAHLSEADARSALLRGGISAAYTESLLEYYRALASGLFVAQGERGESLETFEMYVAKHRSAFE